MKFVLQILGMTNYCNLNCRYCDWEKKKIFPLTEEHIKNARRNLTSLKKFICKDYPEIAIVEYTGGEPFLYPQIIYEILDIFPEKWIRINTNGLLIKDNDLNRIKDHGKVFLSLSLDGNTIHANSNRFRSNEYLLKKVMENIEKILLKGIPLMILCTINKQNIDNFEAYIMFLSEKYKDYINSGMLVLPAHFISQYEVKHDFPNKTSENNFRLKLLDLHLPLIQNIDEHYKELSYYTLTKMRTADCTIYNWSLAIHFHEDQIVQNGKFESFWCGMRAVCDLGLFDINSKKELYNYRRKLGSQTVKSEVKKILKKKMENILEGKTATCPCFTDWVAFDLILSKRVSINKAQEWFILFKDKEIAKFVENYR